MKNENLKKETVENTVPPPSAPTPEESNSGNKHSEITNDLVFEKAMLNKKDFINAIKKSLNVFVTETDKLKDEDYRVIHEMNFVNSSTDNFLVILEKYLQVMMYRPNMNVSISTSKSIDKDSVIVLANPSNIQEK